MIFSDNLFVVYKIWDLVKNKEILVAIEFVYKIIFLIADGMSYKYVSGYQQYIIQVSRLTFIKTVLRKPFCSPLFFCKEM